MIKTVFVSICDLRVIQLSQSAVSLCKGGVHDESVGGDAGGGPSLWNIAPLRMSEADQRSKVSWGSWTVWDSSLSHMSIIVNYPQCSVCCSEGQSLDLGPVRVKHLCTLPLTVEGSIHHKRSESNQSSNITHQWFLMSQELIYPHLTIIFITLTRLRIVILTL